MIGFLEVHFFIYFETFLEIFKAINLIKRNYILPLVVYMKSPLIYDQKDFKWNLLGEILKIFDFRRTQQVMARHGIKPLNKSVKLLKVVLIAIFFSRDVSFVLNELEGRSELQKLVKFLQMMNYQDL